MSTTAQAVLTVHLHMTQVQQHMGGPLREAVQTRIGTATDSPKEFSMA